MATINNNNYDILIDTGASHSYIPSSIVKANCWNVKTVSKSTVTLPDGTQLDTCTAVKLKVEYTPTRLFEDVKFYVLPI